jgi:hypothetical protein
MTCAKDDVYRALCVVRVPSIKQASTSIAAADIAHGIERIQHIRSIGNARRMGVRAWIL